MSKVITLDYKLFKDTANGELIESTENQQPLSFISELGAMIPEFEANVSKLTVGDDFSFGIKSENAYGPRMDNGIIELPKDMFMQDGVLVPEIAVGNIIPLEDNEGNVVPAEVKKVGEEMITVDVNHPLSGQNLHFTGKILEIRDATETEIEHGHVHNGENDH